MTNDEEIMDVFANCLPALKNYKVGDIAAREEQEQSEDQDMPHRGKRSRPEPEQDKASLKGGKGKGGRRGNDTRGQGQWSNGARSNWGQQRMEAATVPGARTACGGPLPPDLEAGGGAPAHQDGEAIPSAHGIRATGDAQASLGGSPGLESGQGQNPSDGAELSPRGLDQVSLSGVDCQARHDDQGPGDTQEDGGTGMGESARETEPQWNFQQWNAQSRRLELDPTRTPIGHTQMVQTASDLRTLVNAENEMLVHRFHSTRKLTETVMGDTMPFILSVAMRGTLSRRTMHFEHWQAVQH